MSRPDQHPHAFGVPSTTTQAPPLLSTTPSVESSGAMSAVAEDAIREVAVNMQKSATFSSRIEKDFRNMASHVATMQAAHKQIAKDSVAAVTQAAAVVEGRPVGGAARAASTAADGRSGAARIAGQRPAGRASSPFTPSTAPEETPHEPGSDPLNPAKHNLTEVDRLKAAATARVNSTLQSHFLQSRPMPAEGTEERAKWERSASRVGRAQKAVSALGEGEGMMGAAKVALGRFAGPVGLALTAVQKGISQAENQRTQNLFYQQVTGGSNASGFAQRMHENAFAWSQMGGMGSEQAREAFKGMTELDPTGRTRQQGLNFVQDEYKNLGMSVQDSLKMISLSIQAGVKDFGVMKTALDDVSSSARAGGINVAEAQQRFASGVAIASSRIGGTAAIQDTAAIQSAANRNGEMLANVDMTGMTSDDAIRRMAGRLGMRNEQFREQADADPSFLAHAQQASLEDSLTSVIGTPGAQAIRDRAAALAAENGGKLTAQAREEMAAHLGDLLGPGYDRRRVITSAARAGVTLTTKNANLMAVDALTRSFDIGAEADKAVADRSLVTGYVETDDKLKAGGYDYNEQQTRADKINSLAKEMGYTDSDTVPDEVRAYIQQVQRTGNRDKNLEVSLLKKGVFDKDKKFGVQVAGGKMRKVGTKDIVERFSDQFDKGQIQVYKGDQALGTVEATMSQTSIDRSRASWLGEGAADSTTANWKTTFGDDIKDTSGNDGTVSIYLKPPYDRMFGFDAMGSAITPSQRSGEAGAATVDPGSSPSANPDLP